ncbi:Ig-like domain-containing protein [Tautonia rosea]|uniref:Ig-like domain-containing protein n=1 Tax=Tautonia rosea TaxID=2728037 RepID=UPI001475F376|nr:hypothetical protein [Tautonia rosea]
MSGNSAKRGAGFLLGTIHNADGRPTGKPKEVCVVEPGTGKEICRVAVDQGGRFLLRGEAVSGSSPESVELRVLCDRGSVMGRAETIVPRSSASQLRVVLDRPAATMAPQAAVAPPRPASGPALVAVGTLARMAEALKGQGMELDGRPRVPAWVNASIRELNTLAALGRRVLEGDRAANRAFLRLVGEPGRGVVPGGSGGPSGAGVAMTFSGRPMRPMPPGGGRGRGGPRSFGGPQPDGSPCIVDAAGAFVATAAGFLLDRLRAERLGDLTQPGALTRQTADLIKDRAFALEAFRDDVLDGRTGRVGGFTGWQPSGPGGGMGPDEPLDWPDGGPFPGGGSGGGPIPEGGPIPGGGPGGGPIPGGGGGIPVPGPGTPSPGGGGGFPCGFWVDCVDEIVDAASNYQPPAMCPRVEDIGSISPSAVCLGASNVELEIRPVEGQSFGGAGQCFAVLQRAFNKKVLLETISRSSNLIRVRLKEAKFSGCVGFRGTVQTPGNIAFIDSCFRMAGMSRNPVLDLFEAGLGPLQIACTGRNRLDVVPPPRLVSLHASGLEGSASGVTQLSLAAEGCTEVVLSWQIDLGSESGWADPDQYIRVEVIASDGTVVGQNLPPGGSLGVTAREDESYVIRAASVVNGSSCGKVEGNITIERYQKVHLTGPESLQVGQSANVTVRISCPAPAGGETVSLSSSDPSRLQVPATVVIPEGQDTSSMSVTATGTGCLDVVLTATAPGHLSDSMTIEVFDTPTLDAIAPQAVQACRTFELQLTGSCFKAGETVVRASKAGEATRTLEILTISATSIRCRGSNFPPGSWTVSVTSRGLQSNARVLDVQAIPADIVSFNAWHNGAIFVPCQGNSVCLSWEVKDAVRIVIKENEQPIRDIELSTCGTSSGTDCNQIITRQATYRLEAFPVGDGAPTPSPDLTVGERGFQSFLLQNNSPVDVVVWKIEGWYSSSLDIPQDQNNKIDLSAGSSITLTFSNCVPYQVVAIDKPAAIDANQDPYGNAIETGSLWRYGLVPLIQLVGESNGEEGAGIVW